MISRMRTKILSSACRVSGPWVGRSQETALDWLGSCVGAEEGRVEIPKCPLLGGRR